MRMPVRPACLAACIVICGYSMPRAETTPEPRGPMDLVSTLESDIARPDDFKRYVEGSRRLPEDPSLPVFARRQDPPREGTSKSWAATPLVPGPMPKSGRFPLTPAPQVPYPLPEVPDSSHRLLLLGLALLPLTALGLSAMALRHAGLQEAVSSGGCR